MGSGSDPSSDPNFPHHILVRDWDRSGSHAVPADVFGGRPELRLWHLNALIAATKMSALLFSTFEVTRQAFYRTPLSFAIVNLKPIVPGRASATVFT